MDTIIKGEKIKWIVTNVIPNKDYTLLITFITGEKKIFDFKKIIDKKTFEPLKNINLFLKAHVESGTVAWNDDIDIAPEYLYDNSENI